PGYGSPAPTKELGMTRGAKSDEDRRGWELFGKRFVWSHFWWVAALLLGLAVARLFLMPVTTDWISGTTTLDCGYTYTADATVVGATEPRQGRSEERRGGRGTRPRRSPNQ